MLAALAQARRLFPFPLLGLDTDNGSEFLNEEMVAYCEQEQLTFTRGRPSVKNDQCHVEQKNGAVVRESVGCVRLVGERAYQQLSEVYRALRLVVNYVQPSPKLRAAVQQGEQVRRVHDVAQTPLQRLLALGVLSEKRQRDLSEQVQQIDPLMLSEQLDTLRHALLCGTCASAADGEEERVSPLLRFSPFACSSGPLLLAEEAPAQAGQQEGSGSQKEDLNGPRTTAEPFASVAPWEQAWPAILLQRAQAKPLSPKSPRADTGGSHAMRNEARRDRQGFCLLIVHNAWNKSPYAL